MVINLEWDIRNNMINSQNSRRTKGKIEWLWEKKHIKIIRMSLTDKFFYLEYEREENTSLLGVSKIPFYEPHPFSHGTKVKYHSRTH